MSIAKTSSTHTNIFKQPQVSSLLTRQKLELQNTHIQKQNQKPPKKKKKKKEQRKEKKQKTKKEKKRKENPADSTRTDQ